MVNWKEILRIFRGSLVIAVIIFVLLGLVIPTATALITEKVDPGTGNGNQIKINGKVFGSYYLAQAFNRSYFFQPRPSAIDFNQSSSGALCCSQVLISGLHLLNLQTIQLNLQPSALPVMQLIVGY